MPIDVGTQLVPRHEAFYEVFHCQAVLGRNALGLLPLPDGLNAYSAAGCHDFGADFCKRSFDGGVILRVHTNIKPQVYLYINLQSLFVENKL